MLASIDALSRKPPHMSCALGMHCAFGPLCVCMLICAQGSQRNMPCDMFLDSGLYIRAQFTKAHICGVSHLCNTCSHMGTDHSPTYTFRFPDVHMFPNHRYRYSTLCTQLTHTHGCVHIHIFTEVPLMFVCTVLYFCPCELTKMHMSICEGMYSWTNMFVPTEGAFSH